MAVTPETNLFLLKCPLQLDNKNQITFSNETAQRNYFLSLPYLENDKFSYQRRDSTIRYPAHIDSIQEYNYCMYQNSNYTNKWFYAFILSMQYVNDNCTLITIATDVYQTWQFDITFKECFVEREHINVDEDNIGANLVPESLEFGEVKENASSSIQGLGACYVIAFSKDPKEVFGTGTSAINGTFANGIGSGLWYYVGNYYRVLEMLKTLNSETYGQGESVISVFTIPTIAIWDGVEDLDYLDDPYSVWGGWVAELYTSHNGRTFNLNPVPTSLDGYTPRNNKLRQFPYCYLGFTPTNGTPTIYRYEDFQDATPSFKLLSEINPNPMVYFIPRNYNGVSGDNVSASATVSGYPSVAYHTDYYSNWIAQNQNLISLSMEQNAFNYEVKQGQNALDYTSSTLDNLGSIFTGNVAGGVKDFAVNTAQTALTSYSDSVNYDYSVKNQMAQIEQHKMLPNSGSTGGSNATLIGYELFNSDIFTRYTIKSQFAERIDHYFDLYGYQTNKVKVPNTTGRPTWNYVKTLGAIITGNIPQGDLNLIKSYFDNGITLWHDTTNFLNYSANNR